MFRLSCFRSFFSDEIETGEKYLSQLKTWVDGGKIQVPPVRTFPFSQLRDAHNALTSGQSVGKMVVTFWRENKSTIFFWKSTSELCFFFTLKPWTSAKMSPGATVWLVKSPGKPWRRCQGRCATACENKVYGMHNMNQHWSNPVYIRMWCVYIHDYTCYMWSIMCVSAMSMLICCFLCNDLWESLGSERWHDKYRSCTTIWTQLQRTATWRWCTNIPRRGISISGANFLVNINVTL